jgi:hypothetical protein
MDFSEMSEEDVTRMMQAALDERTPATQQALNMCAPSLRLSAISFACLCSHGGGRVSGGSEFAVNVPFCFSIIISHSFRGNTTEALQLSLKKPPVGVSDENLKVRGGEALCFTRKNCK